MHYVSLLVEFLRGRPAVVFWTAALTQAALWTLIPTIFYGAPPGEVPLLLAIGREFVLGSYLGPPLAFWLGEVAFRIAGSFGLYALAQACIVLTYWAIFVLGRGIVGTRHAILAILLMVGIAAYAVPSPDFGPAVLAAPLWALGNLFRNSAEPRDHSVDRLMQVRPQLVALRNPPWIVIAKPGLSGRILPDQYFQRQIDTDFLVRLHERRARLGITED